MDCAMQLQTTFDCGTNVMKAHIAPLKNCCFYKNERLFCDK